MITKNATSIVVACLSCALFCACGPVPAPGPAAGPAARPAAKAAQPAPKTIAARVFDSRVDEKNLLLANQNAARDYLRRKLVGILAKKLTSLGFDLDRAKSLAAAGRLEDFGVHGHSEKIPGRGADEGKIVKAVLWDVHGKLLVELSDADVAALGSDLNGLPLDSLAGSAKVSGYLDGFAALIPAQAQLDALKKKVADRWAGLLDDYLKAQQKESLADPQRYFNDLAGAIEALCAFNRRCPRNEKFEALEKILTLSALRWLHTVAVTADNHQRIRDMLARLDKASVCKLPNMRNYISRDLELAWRDRLNKQDAAKVPFPKLKQDFIYFMQDFPNSDFYPELELRFLSRWIDYLVAQRAANIDQLDGLVAEVELLEKRFPSFSQRGGVESSLGKQCLEILSKVAVPDLKMLHKAKHSLAGCDRFLPAGMQTMTLRRRLEQIENRLLEAREDRRERKDLSQLAFFIHWDKAIKSLDWGHALKGWAGKAEFAKAWDAGRDAGADCRCSLDPDEPCRVFDEDGPHGGYEVVARFFDGQLAGVDLCDAYVGSNTAALYKFFDRRYKKAHSARAAAAFMAGAGRQVRFGSMSRMVVDLRCGGGSCMVRYRQGKLLAKMHAHDREMKSEQRTQRKHARKLRVERGWQQRDCVRWGCYQQCQYQGEVFEKKGQRYLVTVTRSDEEPRSVGSRVWVNAGELYDCK